MPPNMPPSTAERTQGVSTSSPSIGLLGFLSDFHNRTILFRRGNWIFVTYGVLAGFAFFVGWSTALWFSAMQGMDTHDIATFYLFFMLPAVLIGARAFSVLREWPELFRAPFQALFKPGFMLHGGVFGGAAALLAYSFATGNSYLLLLDAAAFAMPLGEAVCRLGCYVYGCCWGRPTNNGFGVSYTSPQAKVVRFVPDLRGVKIHPVQIYALVVHLAQFVVLYMLLPYKLFDGMFAAIYLISHAIIRFCLEHFRGDDRGKVGPLTVTNIYSLVCILLGIIAWIVGLAGADTPLDLGIRWIDVASDPVIIPMVLVGLSAMFAFGLHYKQVGNWLDNTQAG
jgi:prolipoprotein diacylglyceryl transferase